MGARSVVLTSAVAAAVVFALTGDALAVAGIRAYRRTLAPTVARAGFECRFALSCSRYAEIVIVRDGLLTGGARAVARVARCGPWTPVGTIDEP
jgi:putative component of membrane protein insertase Oxa1/YidC/SpoIIIJ protein YidD